MFREVIPGLAWRGHGRGTIDGARQRAAEVLSFAAEDWRNADGSAGFAPSLDELRAEPDFRADAVDAVLAAIPLRLDAEAAA